MTEVVQKKGFYEITTDDGGKAKLELRLRARLDALGRLPAPNFSTSSCCQTSTGRPDRLVLGGPKDPAPSQSY